MRKVAVVGNGLQASRRIPAVGDGWEVAMVLDRQDDWHDCLRPDIDAVMVLTWPDSHAEISIAAMEAGKHVLCEKPLARTLDEAREMVARSKVECRVLKCGFDKRHHPAIQQAFNMYIGKPVYARGAYGIGRREGYDKEWRSDPSKVPGGQLMELGIHLVDLMRMFLGDMDVVGGATVGGELERDGMMLMRAHCGAICSIHASLTMWRNTFEFEVGGTEATIRVEGLGGSYGVERLHVTKRGAGPFATLTTEWRGSDVAWKEEWREFVRAVDNGSEPHGSGVDGLIAMKLVEDAYEADRRMRCR